MLRRAGAVVAGVLLTGALPGPSPDRDPSRLRPGLFLYAVPGLPETRFAAEAILALVRRPSPSSGARTVVPDVHLTGNMADVRQALEGTEPRSHLRVYSGYAGWTAGQLPAEVRAGASMRSDGPPRPGASPSSASPRRGPARWPPCSSGSSPLRVE